MYVTILAHLVSIPNQLRSLFIAKFEWLLYLFQYVSNLAHWTDLINNTNKVELSITWIFTLRVRSLKKAIKSLFRLPINCARMRWILFGVLNSVWQAVIMGRVNRLVQEQILYLFLVLICHIYVYYGFGDLMIFHGHRVSIFWNESHFLIVILDNFYQKTINNPLISNEIESKLVRCFETI